MNNIFEYQNTKEEKKEIVQTTSNQYSDILAEPIVILLNQYSNELEAQKRKELSPISVDEIASKIAKLYERFRKIVDWNEENVLRRRAILRILKRLLISKLSKIIFVQNVIANETAETLVLELIRGGHLPNHEIPTNKIDSTAKILEKYIYILENAPYSIQFKDKFLVKEKNNFFNWLLEIASCEIEEELAPAIKENALIKGMTLAMDKRIRILPKSPFTDIQKRTLIYIATCRSLYGLDDEFIVYHMINYHYPEWKTYSEESLIKFTKNIFSIKEGIENGLNHILSHQMHNQCEKTDTIFTLLGDVIDENKNEPAKIFEILKNKPLFLDKIAKSYDKRYKTLKTRLFRMAVISTFSVFAANIVTYFQVEVPLAFLFKEKFTLLAALFDFTMPSAFMFFLVSLIRPPSVRNRQDVLNLTQHFVYKGEMLDVYEIKLKKKRQPVFQVIISSIYVATTLLMLYLCGMAFYIAGIPMSSVVFDTLSIGLNIFAALVIRNKSKELTVTERNSFWEFIIDILTLPMAEVGGAIARKWKEYNFVSVFFNFILEAPFISFVGFIENWRQFLKDKKTDIH